MINDEIIESYLNCKYKAYRIFNNEKGVKKEFELLQKEQLFTCKAKFFNHLLEKYGKNKLSKGYKFESNSRTPRAKVLIQPISDNYGSESEKCSSQGRFFKWGIYAELTSSFSSASSRT